ncbi:MAG: hydantoinase/oxoprolinase family protein [Halobacteriales archaeon]
MAGDARIGVDVGGTFTDVVTVSDGRARVRKVPSTPETPAEGVLDGVEAGVERSGIDTGSVGAFVHGTTVATNAVLEGEWAETALLTTEGFRDALEIGRQNRPDLYDIDARKPDPIVPRNRRYGIEERLDERGEVLTPLSAASVENAIEALPESVESVAVSFLFAFENDDHERRVRERLETETDLSVSVSSEVLPEIREYERTLATALDAALSPVMASYLGALETRIADAGVPAGVKVMGSNGGSMAAETARNEPIRTLLSGPAAGVRGAAHVASIAGVGDAITMDMGGTSCDVSLVTGGEPVVSTEVTVGPYPVPVPMVDVHTIGAGGGSIAWVDEGGALRVGPRSAGADPGPICYGGGGTEPTVTDAHFMLGRLDPGRFDAGFTTDPDAVRAGIQEHVAEPMGTSIEEAAAGIIDVANANTERALRVVSVERGHDPRDLGLVAFGGAGPLHAAELAAALDVAHVLVPQAAGALSALGLLASDTLYDYGTSRVRDWASLDPAAIEERFAAFEARGGEQLAEEGVPADRQGFERALEVRYAGQAFDLAVDAPDPIDADALETVAERFHERHETRYGHASPGEPLELTAIRLRARGRVDAPDLRVEGDGDLDDARRETRRVRFGSGVDGAGESREAVVYDGDRLPVGARIEGPVIVEGSESTVVVPPGSTGERDDRGTLHLGVSV